MLARILAYNGIKCVHADDDASLVTYEDKSHFIFMVAAGHTHTRTHRFQFSDLALTTIRSHTHWLHIRWPHSMNQSKPVNPRW